MNNQLPIPTAEPSKEQKLSPTSNERLIGFAVAIWIIGLSSYIIITNHQLDIFTARILIIMLSLSIGILFYFISGLLDVTIQGIPQIAVRAGGGAAAFVLVLIFGMKFIEKPNTTIGKIVGIDLRAIDGPDPSKLAQSPFSITISPIAVSNKSPMQSDGYYTATLGMTSVSIVILGSRQTLKWQYFVQLLPGPGGTWLTSDKIVAAHPIDIKPAETFATEVMHIAAGSAT